MASFGTPAETQDYILERLVGATGEPDRVTGAARAVGERAVSTIVTGIVEALSISLEVEVKRVDILRFADARPKAASHAVATVASSPSSPDALLMVLDGATLGLIVGAVFGGDPEMPSVPIERDPSPTEIELAATVFGIVAEALNGHGPRALDIRFPLAAPISGAELKKLALRDAPAVRIVFSLSTKATNGEVCVVIPQRVLLQHRGDAIAAGTASGPNVWGARFGEEVMRSTVEVVATMPVGQKTLGELSVLEIGHVIAFDEAAQANVLIAARGKTLFACEFGKVGQNYSVRVRAPYEPNQEIIDGLLPATG